MIELRSTLANSLTNHAPNPAQVEAIERIRKAADDLCLVMDEVCVGSRETSLAKTHLEEVTMWAVKSVILNGKV